MSSTISDLVRKAHGAIAHLRGSNNLFLGKDGEIIYSKNNVCVHERANNIEDIDDEENAIHTPGYLTVHVLSDDLSGVTLVLQWLPNTTLEKNPASIRCVSPRGKNSEQGTSSRSIENFKAETDDETEEGSCATTVSSDNYSHASTEICVEMNGDMVTVTNSERPRTLSSNKAHNFLLTNNSNGLDVPNINIIPNTPVDPRTISDDEIDQKDARSESSGATSGADEGSDKEDLVQSSSCEDDSDSDSRKRKSMSFENYRKNFETIMNNSTPEQFAKEHNLILDSVGKEEESGVLVLAKERVIFQQKPTSASLFSVNLGKMRSMRIFYSNVECTSGQLVIASPDSQYKILHFHHGGLDRLGQLFEQWNSIKSRSVKDTDSPSPFADKHLLICHPELNRSELDPEDGLYDRLSWELQGEPE